MVEKKPVDWSALASVWNCFEELGLSPKRIDEIVEYLTSPVMLVGGGAGLVPKYLISNAYETTAIDSCPEMVHLSRERGVYVQQMGFLENNYPSNSYSTLIFSTGTVDSNTVEDRTLDNLLSESKRLVKPQGRTIMAYFIENKDKEYIYDCLGLNQEPSNNKYFFEAEDLQSAKKLFSEKTAIDNSVITTIFSEYHGLIEEHQAFVKRVGELAKEKGYEPSDFIARNFSFKTFDLPKEAEEKLLFNFSNYFSNVQQLTLSDTETGVVIGEYK